MLEAPETIYAPKTAPARGARKGPSPRRELSDDFARPEAGSDSDGYGQPRRMRFSGLRFRIRGGVPRSVAGRVIAGGVALAGLVGFTAMLWGARSMLLEDPTLVIRSFSSIQTVGNEHLTRAQLLSVFGEDVDRNLLTVSLEDRKAQLERLPWVEHATVMRLLPDKIRVAIVERTPIAFVRQGSQIGLVDRNGVLLDMTPNAAGEDHYSFPVVTGISAGDPISVRAARMALFQRFLEDLDAGKDKVSQTISEVDLSSPEDVKALIPSGSGTDARDILVHFGDDDFLRRYQKYEERLPDWKEKYLKLASVDMRYERQVVLEMARGAEIPANGVGAEDGKAIPTRMKTATAPVVHGKTKAQAKARTAALAHAAHLRAVAAAHHATQVEPQ